MKEDGEKTRKGKTTGRFAAIRVSFMPRATIQFMVAILFRTATVSWHEWMTRHSQAASDVGNNDQVNREPKAEVRLSTQAFMLVATFHGK